MSVALAHRELRPGERVYHWEYGAGRVLCEWGNFRSCKLCFREAPLGTEIEVREVDGQFRSEEKAVRCVDADCGGPTQVVSGAGVYEVIFDDGKLRSIHSQWLVDAETRREAA